MAPRQSQPGRPSGVTATATTLPPYEPPSHPLSTSAQQALQTLANNNSMAKLKRHYALIEVAIPKSAGEVNDVLYTQGEKAMQVKKRRRKQGLEDEGTDEELENTREIVGDLTKKMEAAMRKVIDGQVMVEDMEEGITFLRQNARQLTLTQAGSQAQTQGGRRTRGRRRAEAADEDEEDEDMEDEEDADSPGPTPLTAEGVEITGPSKLWKSRLQEKKDKWQLASNSARYAENNSYIGFRKVVNDAQHPSGEVPLPHASTWFTENGEPALGVTAIAGAAAGHGGDESDDDIMVSGANISTKCPITLTEFKKPVTSSKCPHSYEEFAIKEMINSSGARLGPGAGRKAVQCPVSGCSQMICVADLHTNEVLVRMIERIRKAKDDASDDEDDNAGPSGSSMQHAESLVSSPPHAAKASTTQLSRARSTMPEQQPPQSSIILDLGGSDDDSDETEEE